MNKKITLSLLALLVAISAGLFLMAHPAHACACDVAPDTVTGLSATATIYSEATLSWNTPTNNGPVITDYYIQYRLYNTGGWTDISHTPSDATSTTLSGLSQNTIYEFQVAAVNSIGTSTMSDPLQFATTLSTTYTDATFVLASNTSSRFLGINMFNTIQAAINAVDDGGQVDIASSTYSEHLSVGRDISLYGEDSSDLIRTVHLISPDCEVPLMLISASTTFMQGLDLDQNDMSHTCTVPMIIVSPGAAFLSIANIFENASLAMEAAATSTVVNALTDFTNDTTAIRSDSVESFVYEPYNYWGSDTGPLQTITNPTGVGASIIGTGGANVFFRPYMNEDIMNPDVAPVVLATTTYDHIQDLLGNGGSFIPFSFIGEFPSADPTNDTQTLLVNEPVAIAVPANGSSSIIFMPGFPFFFGPGLQLVSHDSSNFDATQIAATTTATSSVLGLPHNAHADGTVLQFGIPGTRLDVSNGGPVSISLFVGDSFDGQTMGVFRSESLSSGWTQDGLVSTTCVVASGYCNFTTNSFSYFAASVAALNTDHIYANSDTGNDSTGTGSSSAPYRTFTKAYTEALDNDTIDLTGTFDWTNEAETSSVSGSGFTISKNLTILGQGATSTFVQAANAAGIANRSVFTIASGKTVTIDGLTVCNGVTSVTETGAGITNHGILNVYNSIIDHNQSDIGTDYYSGGGIYDVRGGTLTISTSTISNNSFAGQLYGAGGVMTENITVNINATTFTNNTSNSTNPTGYPYDYAEPAGALRLGGDTAHITNSTFFANHTNSFAGGINSYRTDLWLTNDTIVANTADQDVGGLLYRENSGSHLNIKNTIISDNMGDGSSDFYAYDTASANQVVDNGYNIIKFTQNKTWTGTGDIYHSQTGLHIANALADNGATNGVQTLALLSGSVAIDAGDSDASSTNSGVAIPTVDARGLYRDNFPDIGAFEYNGLSSLPGAPAPVLTQVTPIAPSTTAANALYAFSVSGDMTGYEYVFGPCGATVHLDSVGHIVTFTGPGLDVGSTHECSFKLSSHSGPDSNSLTIGPFTIIASPVSTPTVTVAQSVSSGGSSASSQYSNLVAMGQLDAANQVKTKYPWMFSSSTAPAGISRTVGEGSFSRYLSSGSVGNDVRTLQMFLNAHGFTVSTSGAGSSGHETTTLGPKTVSAIKKFQEAHASQVLVPQGLKKGNGRIGPATLKLIQSLIAG